MIELVTFGQSLSLGVGTCRAWMCTYWHWYDVPDSLHWWQQVPELGDVIYAAWSPDGSHWAWDIWSWATYVSLGAGVYYVGWPDLVDHATSVMYEIRPGCDILPDVLYWAPDRSWVDAWYDISPSVAMVIWLPRGLRYRHRGWRLPLPWYQ